jgi:hypothetical protein
MVDIGGLGSLFSPFYQHQWAIGLLDIGMGDQPRGNWTFTKYMEQRFETCAVCTQGGDKGFVFGCVRWGHRFFARNPRSDPWVIRRWASLSGQSQSLLGTIPFEGAGGPEIDLGWAPGLSPTSDWVSTIESSAPTPIW